MCVGDSDKFEKKTFVLHQELIVRHSQFCASALSKDWRERKEGHIALETDDPEIFEVFRQFLYSGNIFSIKDGDLAESTGGSKKQDDQEWLRLGQCWILGDKLISTSFKDAVTDALIIKMRDSNYHPTQLYRAIYRESAGPCGMRKLMADIAAYEWDQETLSKCDRSSDLAEFFYDVMLAQKAKEDDEDSVAPVETGNTCDYHDHGDLPCYKTMF